MNDGCLVFVAIVLIAFASALLTSKIYENNPSAMDVYQGKTALEYTVVDGVKVDSTVIWKNKEE